MGSYVCEIGWVGAEYGDVELKVGAEWYTTSKGYNGDHQGTISVHAKDGSGRNYPVLAGYRLLSRTLRRSKSPLKIEGIKEPDVHCRINIVLFLRTRPPSPIPTKPAIHPFIHATNTNIRSHRSLDGDMLCDECSPERHARVAGIETLAAGRRCAWKEAGRLAGMGTRTVSVKCGRKGTCGRVIKE